MSRIKTCIFTLLLPVSLLFSSTTLAFTMPAEFASLDVLSVPAKKLARPIPSKSKVSNSKISEHVKAELLTKYSHWQGTQYKLGGTTRRGIDCSALMQHFFDDALNKPLPRTTSLQIKHGREVGKENLKPGDLVFFKTTPTDRHVGVYVGNKQFIHASQIKGVTISSLDSPYWGDRYETARRLLES